LSRASARRAGLDRSGEKLLPVARVPMRPLASKDGQNARYAHWTHKIPRARAWRDAISAALWAADWPVRLEDNGRDYVITFRVGQRRGVLMDTDNLQGCLKGARDKVAECLGVSDGPDGPTWRYEALRASEDYTEIVLEQQERPAPLKPGTRMSRVARAAERLADAAGVHWDGETPVLEIEVEAQFWTALKEALEGE
jgi:hypothetical protein